MWLHHLPTRTAWTSFGSDRQHKRILGRDEITQSPTGLVPSRAATVPTAQSSATLADTTLSHAAPADTTSRPIFPLGIETPTSSALSSVSDAITRLQRERDLALRSIDELHTYYKRERKSLEESHGRRDSSLSRDYLKVSGDLELTKH